MSVSVSNEAALIAFLTALAGTGRLDVHAVRNSKADGTATYNPVSKFPDQDGLRAHLSGERPIGIYLLNRSTVRAAVIDLDDHDGSTGFETVCRVAAKIAEAMRSKGLKPVVFRSGGGQGIHIWLAWKEPQPAAAVRRMLKGIVNDAGLRNGTRGVGENTVEIYPKQDEVKDGKYGNLIALPLSRKSVALSSDVLKPLGSEQFSVPDENTLYSPPVIETTEAREEGNTAHRFSRLAGDENEIDIALRFIPAEDYDVWIRVGFILKSELGESGLAVWAQWSRKSSEKFELEKDIAARWASFPMHADIGLATLFYLARQHGWNGPGNEVVREMNARFGILTVGRKTSIILKNGDRRPDDEFALLSKETFIDRLRQEPLSFENGRADSGDRDKAKFWMKHHLASHFHSLDFDPSKPPGANGSVWNLWSGFAVSPRAGQWDLFTDHIRQNICRGDDTTCAWLLNWMALGVQKPGLVIGTAPVLKGFPGTGKGILANMYGRLWGRHYTTITNESHVSGRFNAHLAGKRLVFIDEGTFGGNRREAGVLKTRITEDWIVLEAKGVDPIRMRNRMICMIASNEDSVVPADRADRRWQLFTVGDERRGDRQYFGSIIDQMNNGGTEAMLFDLLSRDISRGPDPQVTIKNDELFHQIISAAAVETRYLHQLLSEGRLPQNDIKGPASTTTKALLMECQTMFPAYRHVSLGGLGRFIRTVIPGIQSNQAGQYRVRETKDGPVHERSTRYDFPDLTVSRACFDRHIGQAVPWPSTPTSWVSDINDGGSI